MRVMVIVKANQDSEAGKLPSEKELSAMMSFNEELVKSGIMLAGEGLHPSSRGKRVRWDKGGAISIKDGPFAETKELIAGFWLWRVSSMDEALAWARRIPNPEDSVGEIEIRQVFDADDFGDNMTPELRAQEERLRAETSRS